jgi:membrane protein DedA with SNARE-associated domain
VIGSVGAVLGTLPWYGIARWLDKDKVYAWVDRHGHWLTVERGELERSEKWFSNRGRWIVAAGRLVPGLRTLISVPAGFAKVPFGQYLAYSLAGTLIWTGALAHLGKALGENYSRISTYVGHITYAVVGSMLLVYLVRLVRMRRRNHARGAAGRRESHA